MNITTVSRTTRRLAAGSLLALTAVVGLAACGDDDSTENEQMEEQMEDTGSDVMTETTEAMTDTTEAMMEDDAMTESTEAMTEDSMTEDSMTEDSMTEDSMTEDSMTEATTAP